MKGLFVALEGSDGSGKSTVLEGIKKKLAETDIDYIVTREPGGTSVAEKIREIILDKDNEGMDDRCEALLYAAARAEHTNRLIVPALNEGKLVISDRYVLSSLAYQGYGRKLGIDEVSNINKFATCGTSPDLVIFLNVDPIKVLERKAKAAEQDRLEVAGEDFHLRVYEGYQKAIYYMDNVKVIDAGLSKEEVLNEVWQAITNAWEGRK